MTTTTETRPSLAVKGLAGWHEEYFQRSRAGGYTTWSSPCDEDKLTAPVRVDMSHVYQAEGISRSAVAIWKRPNLDLSLPEGNVRGLLEGCIGCGGSKHGRPFNGDLSSLKSTDSVGLEVYVAILEASGGIVTRI